MTFWDYIITIVVGAFMAVVGVGAVVAFFVFVARYSRQRQRRVTELKASGMRGEAIILRLPRSDMRGYGGGRGIYNLVSIGLEIRVPGVPPYEMDKTFTIPSSFVRFLEVGKTVEVWIDPNNPYDAEKIVIDIKETNL